MRHLLAFGAILVTIGCGGDTGGGSGTGGSAGAGGAAGAAGMGGSGGTGSLKWFATCGPPVCQTNGGSSSSARACTATEKAGASCSSTGAECDPGTPCSGPLMCTTSDPTHGGQCPVSRAKYKTDIEYLSPVERAKFADDLQAIPLVRYRYKDGSQREHLGFIIEDVEPSPAADSQHDQVDLYGYTSMAVAALQQQHREIEALAREVKELRTRLARRPARAESTRTSP